MEEKNQIYHEHFISTDIETMQYEVPYYTYKDYEEKYEDDLNSFFKKYPNAEECDYLKEIEKCYKSWVDGNQNIWDYTIMEQLCPIEGGGYTEQRISLNYFGDVVNSYFKVFAKKAEFNLETFREMIEERDNFFTKNSARNSLEHTCKKYSLSKKYHLKFYKFLSQENGQIIFDLKKYEDFGFTIRRILNDIKIKLEKSNNTPVYHEDEVLHDDHTSLSIKQKLIVLQRLGIIDYIKSIQTTPENITHTSQIIAYIIEGKEKTIKSYLNPMLTEAEGNFSNNNPYNVPQNKIGANEALSKMKIDPSKLK